MPNPHAQRRDIARVIDTEAITPLFQPIVDLERAGILGYEGLSRGPSDSWLHSPLILFEAAAQCGQLVELETCALRVIVRRFVELALPGQLFLNVSVDTLVASLHREEVLRREFARLDLPPSRIVIELTESRAVLDQVALRQAIDGLRKMGFVIALDDLGEGFASLRRWSELRPDFVKIDRHFIDGLSRDPMKQQFIKSILDIATSSGCNVIAEGLEEEADLRVLRQLGMPNGQGYLFSKPQPAPRTTLKPEIDVLLGGYQDSTRLYSISGLKTTTASQLAKRSHTVRADFSCARVLQMFRADPRLSSLPVLDDEERPIGILRSLDTMSRAADRFFLDLFGKRSCTEIMDRSPLVFDASASLRTMSDLVANIDERFLVDGFIVTQDGGYFGSGRISDLIKAVSDLQLFSARYANPLTLLPGNVPIDEHIDSLLRQQAEFVVVHWDLGSFKAYNDLYGYRAGDEIILFSARVLAQAADPDRDFLGHVGGDDFVMVLTSQDWEARIQRAIASFDSGVRAYFSDEHLAVGGYVTQNRQGQEMFHALVSIAAGVARVRPRDFDSHRMVARSAAEAKKIAKTREGSNYFVERRNGRTRKEAGRTA
ncbi:GGDEF domain-containing protein [Uliginosibacterium sp. H1]|uniref:GGDEF domain-containing protein n=1 Tax=Uliginosibacterium sp. H1 TaxID=3114757 RepID=UPI002E17B47F|nr:GGDEF domain-containing protein [Uliginosibacterium sp. H1]